MATLSEHEIMVMLLAVAALLAAARLLGEAARRVGQPAILGEILAGFLLGPTVLGALAPGVSAFLFPPDTVNAVILSGLATLAVVLFLLVAGLEVDLSMIFRLRRQALLIGLVGLLVPFAVGAGIGYAAPVALGMAPGAERVPFALFFGVALAIPALPVIARTLMDLHLFQSDLGMLVIAAAMLHSLLGWIIFALVLGMMGGEGAGVGGVAATIGLTVLFIAVMLTVGRWAIHRALPWVTAHASWPGGVLGFVLVLGLLGAALTEWIGIHAIFGALIVGLVVGDSAHLPQRARVTIEQFISFIFAPLFFATIGLRVDLVAHFDLGLVVAVTAIACVAKTLGCALGGWWAGMPGRQSWAVGFALNARGAMEIVLAVLALEFGVIGERLFVALVVMALVTSVMAGPLIQWVLQRKRPAHFRDHLHGGAFLPDLAAATRDGAIRELAAAVEPIAGASGEAIRRAVEERERTMPTAVSGGLAVPHAHVPGMEKPIVAIGFSHGGLDFNAGDAQPTRLIVMVLTPPAADEAQTELLAEITSTFESNEMVGKALRCPNYVTLLALLRVGE